MAFMNIIFIITIIYLFDILYRSIEYIHFQYIYIIFIMYFAEFKQSGTQIELLIIVMISGQQMTMIET
jgi:hypothetical protein